MTGVDDADDAGSGSRPRRAAPTSAPPTRPPATRTRPDRPEPDRIGDRPPPVAPLWLARLAGMVAAAVALGVGELVSALAGTGQSLVGSVGNEVIDRAGGAVVRWAVESLGTRDKPALVIGTVVICLLAGAVVGGASARRPWIGTAGFVAFGAVGVVCSLRDPQAAAGWALVAVVLAVAAGIGILRLLLRIAATGRAPVISTRQRYREAATAARSVDTPTTPHASRREFFTWAGAATAFAGVAAWGARSLATRSAVEATRATITLPPAAGGNGASAAPGASAGISGLTSYITPNRDFYKIDTALLTPQVDVASWRLKVTGMVDRPFEIGFDELLKLPQVKETVTLSCVSNEVGGDLVGNAVWQGVPIRSLLERAGVKPGATQLMTQSVDGFTAGFPTEVALDGRVAMVAIGMNGEALPVDHGFPARLVVAGLYGYVSATKWVSELRLTTWDAEDGYWIPRGWSKKGPIKTQTRIDVPRAGAVLAAGRQPIAGTSWAPSRGITRVEVQVDGGPWQEARLSDVVSDNTWRQWVLDWDATPGPHRIVARATDGTGEVQTEAYAPPAPDGASGWPTRSITVQ